MSPELGKNKDLLPQSPENALIYLRFILGRPDVARKLNDHFEAIDIKVRVSDLVEFLNEPDYLKYLKEELGLFGRFNLRTAFIKAVDKIEREKELVLPQGEEKTRLLTRAKALRESFNVRIKGSQVSHLVQNMPECWQKQCIANYSTGQGCEIEDSDIIDLCVRVFEPGRSSLGPKILIDGKRGTQGETDCHGHLLNNGVRAPRKSR